MTLLVRDEQDIIEANLSYHLAQGVDFVIVTDNRSSDATPELLERFAATGRVHIISEAGDDYDQTAWVTRMARLAATDHGADWVINADADEFWWPKCGDLRAALGSVPSDVGAVSVGRSDFLPVSVADGPFYQRMLVRETVSRNVLGDPLQPKVCHRASPEVVVEQGNHGVTGVAGRLLAEPESPLFVLHYPLRDYAQYERKIQLGGQAYQRNTKLPWITGSGWRLRYEDYQAGRLREWWDGRVLDEAAVAHGLGEGTLVFDRRLQAFFSDGLPATAPRSVEPVSRSAAPTRAVAPVSSSSRRRRSLPIRAAAKAKREVRRRSLRPRPPN
jgi:glycosyl transferase family 2